MNRFPAVIFLALAVLAAISTVYAQESELRKVEITFKDESVVNAYVLYFDTSGIKVKGENDIVVFYPWTIIRNEIELKKVLGMLSPEILLTEKDAAQNIQLLEQQGISITLKDGRNYRGKEIFEFSDLNSLVIKSRGKLHKFARNDIAKREDVLVNIREINSDDELYEIVIQDRIISTADDHFEIARTCEKLGLKDKTEFHYWMYELIRRGELPSNAPYRKLLASYSKTQDNAVKEILYLTGKDVLNDNYRDSVERLETYLKTPYTGSDMEELENLLKELKILSQLSLETRIVNYWYLYGESLVRNKAFDRNANLAAAQNYIQLEITNEIVNTVSQKFSLGREAVKSIWINRNTTDFMAVSYGEGAWVKEAPQIKDAEKWWLNSSNAVRLQYLKAFYAETNMQVISIFHKDCPACGGAGKLYGTSGDDFTVCNTCNGLGIQRVVSYR